MSSPTSQPSLESRTKRIVVLSGPSGSGKSTLISRVLADPDIRARLAVSATTRAPREGEVDGQHYHFWSEERFSRAIEADEFIEWAEVHGHRYGTPRSEVDSALGAGNNVILDIDVQGAKQIREHDLYAKFVFVRCPTLADYEKRLRGRRTEDELALQRRLKAVTIELAHASEYDVEIINERVEDAVVELKKVFTHSDSG